MQRREVLRALLALAAAPTLLTLGSLGTEAQEESSPLTPPASGPAPAATPTPGAAAEQPGPESQPPASEESLADTGPMRNNFVGLNIARLHQPLYIWAASDLINANGGDWGYITVVWTAEDRENRAAELNLQVFLDRCFEFHVQPIIRVATRFEPKKYPTPEAPEMRPTTKQQTTGVEGTWARPDWDEPVKWRTFFEKGRWPMQRAWIVAGNEPNLGREWGGEVDAAGYAHYLNRFLDVFEDSPLFKVVNGALDISNTTQMPIMQDALEFLDGMGAAVPRLFSRLGAWASNPYKVTSRGPGVRFTHLAYEAELDRIGREMPVIITEAGALETGDEQEIAQFYGEAFAAWANDPKVIAATPLFWHPDRNDYWMFELDRRGAFVHKSPTYELMRRLPRVAGSPNYVTTLTNTARTTPFETVVAAAAPSPSPAPALKPTTSTTAVACPPTEPDPDPDPNSEEADGDTPRQPVACEPGTTASTDPASTRESASAPAGSDQERTPASATTGSAPPVTTANTASTSAASPDTERTPASASSSGPAAAPSTGAQAGQPQTTASTPARASRVVVRTGGIGATLRAEPSLSGELMTILPDGTQLEAVGPARPADELSWQQVRTRDGREGWVAAELLIPLESPGE